MEGLWSGYDETNQQISSGKYTFTPVFDAFEIEDIRPELIPAVVDIADQRLGKDYMDSELIEKSLDTETNYFTRIAVVNKSFESDESLANKLASSVLEDEKQSFSANPVGNDTKESTIVGFCLGAMFSQGQLLDYLNFSKDDLPEALIQANEVGVIRTIAVRDGFEGRGIGTTLVGDSIEVCLDRGATALCSIGWREEGRVNIGGIMNYYDFDAVDEYENYWSEESKRLEYHCESCGVPPCTCSAVLFTRYR